MEKSQREYKEMQHKANREVAKIKQNTGRMTCCMKGWTLRKEKRFGIFWQAREIKLGGLEMYKQERRACGEDGRRTLRS